MIEVEEDIVKFLIMELDLGHVSQAIVDHMLQTGEITPSQWVEIMLS